MFYRSLDLIIRIRGKSHTYIDILERDLMLEKLFVRIPKKFQDGYINEKMLSNYKSLMVIGIGSLLVQFFVYFSTLKTPFEATDSVLSAYYLFYQIMIGLNFVFLVLTNIYIKKYKLSGKAASRLLAVYLMVLHVWAMCVAVADQFQGEDIVVYYLSIFVIAIVLNMSLIEMGTLFVLVYLAFRVILHSVSGLIPDTSEVEEAALQYIFFGLIICYHTSELRKRNFMQRKSMELLNHELTFLSYFDPLSNLYNRRKWEELYHEMYQDAVLGKERLTLIIMDIDYFKQYNDYYGHVAGDEVIRIVSKILKESTRDYNANLGRYGGDEFVLSMKDISYVETNHLINTIMNSVMEEDVENIGAKNGKLSLSIGWINDIPEGIDDAWDYVVKADRRLYEQKSNRKRA